MNKDSETYGMPLSIRTYQIMRVPEEKEGKKAEEKMLEEIMAKNFLNLTKNINLHV